MTRELGTLRDELAQLRLELAALRAHAPEAEMHDVGGRVSLSMRAQHRCLACAGEKILHIDHILDRSGFKRRELSVDQQGWSAEGVGRFAAVVCARCGAVEWYIKDVTRLTPDGEVITLLTPPARPVAKNRPPYR